MLKLGVNFPVDFLINFEEKVVFFTLRTVTQEEEMINRVHLCYH